MDACTDDDGNWRMAPLLRQPRPGGADAEWRARQPQDPAVRRALDVWSDPGATRAQREWAARVLLDAGVPGVWRGGLPAEAAEAPRLLPAGEPASLAGQPERLLPAGEYPDRVILYQGITGSRLQKYLAEGLEMSPEGYRGAGLYTTPEFEEAVGWVLRHGSDKNYVLRYEVESDVWGSLNGRATDIRDSDTARFLVEHRLLASQPELIAGFPTKQADFDALINKAFPRFTERMGSVEAVDYLHGEVPLVWGAPYFGYEYAFKSRYAIQDVLGNPSVTRIWIAEITPRAGLHNLEWRLVSFPRR